MSVFFFQAEDGIRDGHVTGVQTCALPIWFGRKPERLANTPSRPSNPSFNGSSSSASRIARSGNDTASWKVHGTTGEPPPKRFPSTALTPSSASPNRFSFLNLNSAFTSSFLTQEGGESEYR